MLAGTELCGAKPCVALPRREVTELSSTPEGHPTLTGWRRFPVLYQVSGWVWGCEPQGYVAAYAKDKWDVDVWCFRTYNNVSLPVVARQHEAQLHLHLKHC